MRLQPSKAHVEAAPKCCFPIHERTQYDKRHHQHHRQQRGAFHPAPPEAHQNAVALQAKFLIADDEYMSASILRMAFAQPSKFAPGPFRVQVKAHAGVILHDVRGLEKDMALKEFLNMADGYLRIGWELVETAGGTFN